jgi:signal transduction histidine kinase
VTWLLARRQARRLALPIEHLAKAASRLGEGDFSVRTRPSGIPEIDSAAACLDATAERLGDLITRERAFSAEASHQLRTPLTGLKLRLEAALDDPSADLSQVITEVDRLEDTIADLLSLARGTPRRSQPMDLRTLMTEIEQSWHGELAAQARPLRIKIGPELPSCLASTAAVRQILAVLVDNAVRHGVGTVTVEVREANDALAVEVIDDGDLTGVDVFSGRSTRAGHGIGLPMARRLAEAEGGRLSLTAVKPTTFRLLLPADQPIVGSR